MSDRILVLHEGRITAEIARADATEEAGDVRRDRQPRMPPGRGRVTIVADSGAVVTRVPGPRSVDRRVARQRELSLVGIMVVLGALVSSRRRSS